jgi:2-polyprenyl-3-methyl-5-hydroxy-6-metoxy-1,4-benzoquinol methylase
LFTRGVRGDREGDDREPASVAAPAWSQETGGVTIDDDAATASEYVLGHSEAELHRLTVQAGLVEPITRQLLTDAGVEPGMRVLDVGTGRGDVALLLAEFVGKRGSVVGVDRAPAAIALAQQRAAELPNVSFRAGDPTEIAFSSRFDAVVGRYVLQFQPDPAALLRLLAARVQPGGIVAFHEIDWSGHRSVPSVQSWDRCCRLVTRAILAGGANLDTGGRLPSFFAAAGLPAPSMRMTTIVGAGANSHDVVERMAGLVRSLRPRIEELGLADPGEIDALARRIPDDVAASASFIAAGSDVTAWSRLTPDSGA